MKVDRALKREIMEMVHNAFSDDSLASRKEVCERVMSEMAHRPEVMERAQEVSLEHMLESIVGEYVRRTRARIRDETLSGQTGAGVDAPPLYEVVSKVRLTIPFGDGEFEDKPALLCTLAEVSAARSYYSRQKRAIDKRESYCGALEKAMREAELEPHATVQRLYAA